MRTRLVCLAAWLCFPVAAFGQIDYDRHVIFDNSHEDARGTSGARSVQRMDGERRLPVDGSHYQTPTNPLWLNWRSATGGDWTATLD